MPSKRRTVSQFLETKNNLEQKENNDHLSFPIEERAPENHDCHLRTMEKPSFGSRSNIKDLVLSTRSTYQKSVCSLLQASQMRSQPTPKFAISPLLTGDSHLSGEKQNMNTLNSTQEPYHEEKVRVYGSKGFIEEKDWFNFFSGELEDDLSSLSSQWEEWDDDRENQPSAQQYKEIMRTEPDNHQDSLDSFVTQCSTELPDPDTISCPLGCCSPESLQKTS